MAVTYRVIPKRNPNKPDEPQKFYANTKANGEMNFRQLAKDIAAGSTTVSDSDAMAVLNELIKILCRHLGDGKIVRFGEFGSFQTSISSDGAESEDKFKPSLIKGGKILFRPGQDLREMLKNLKYAKVK
jgi:predicted histone-like DNA-binding protein